MFSTRNETIQHLLFDCQMARSVWRIVEIALRVPSPISVSHMWRQWLRGVRMHTKKKIISGVAVIFWVIWRCRNDIVFHKKSVSSFMQVIFSATYWLRHWTPLRRPEDQVDLHKVCHNMEVVALQVFAPYGWRANNRIGS